MEKIFNAVWAVPFGEIALKFDPLSLIFLVAIIVLVVCGGIYGVGYMRAERGQKSCGGHVFFYLLLTSALLVVVTANNVILFLGAWETMSVAVYFLIAFHDEKASVRRGAFLYLIAAHCGTFCLFIMFFLMSTAAGSMNFDVIARTNFAPFEAGLIFVLAVLGFGVKAGFIPMHIWLPHAHPAAPSHVSALLSGVAIKTGIYGICRIMWMVGALPVWCAYLLIAIGIVSGVMGVLYAIGQHELKKLLAYHSIENIGIITLGLGLGLLGHKHQMPFLAALGYAGALLHVLNHSIFKGLLFLGAGSVIQQTHTGEMDRLGGLAKTMPLTHVLFLTGALSICGLPLFNGFISEFIIYFGLFQGLLNLTLLGVVTCAMGILALALMGALALACFSKVHGTVFLGQARSILSEHPATPQKETTSKWMLVPMLVLALLCLWIGLAPQTMVRAAFDGATYLTHSARINPEDLSKVLVPLNMVIGAAFLFMALGLALHGIRRWLLGPVPMAARESWRCGYSRILPKVQYTAASFAGPITEFFRNLLLFRRHGIVVAGDFPGKAHHTSNVHDVSEENLFRPLLANLTRFSKKLDSSLIRHTQMYLLYIFLYLIFLLVWKLK